MGGTASGPSCLTSRLAGRLASRPNRAIVVDYRSSMEPGPITNRPMTDRTDQSTRSLRADFVLALALIALCVAARLLPHVQNFSPVAAAALFAGAVMGRR